MFSSGYQAIEFWGGPIDGYVTLVESNPKAFVFLKTQSYYLDNSTLAHLMRLLFFRTRPCLIRIAIYELGRRKGRDAYLFLRSAVATEPVSGQIAQQVKVSRD